MKHLIIVSAAMAGLAAPASAYPVHPDMPPPAEETQSDSRIELPSEQDMRKILEDMPDFNAILDDVSDVATDPRFRDNFKNAGDKLQKRLAESGALETRENGLPYINALLEVMMLALADEEIAGAVTEPLNEMAGVMEKHADEFKAKRDD